MAESQYFYLFGLIRTHTKSVFLAGTLKSAKERWLGQKHAVLLLREQQRELVTAKQRVTGSLSTKINL
ncbi:MAG: hypothetical protein IJZ71_01005 [Treponema sp.]|nr:hypothetical protein [Treponema sp.]